MIIILSIFSFLVSFIVIFVIQRIQRKQEKKSEVWKPDGYILGKNKEQIKVKILDSYNLPCKMVKIQYFSGYFWNIEWIKKSEFFKNRTLGELNDVVYKLKEKLDEFNNVLHKLEEK